MKEVKKVFDQEAFYDTLGDVLDAYRKQMGKGRSVGALALRKTSPGPFVAGLRRFRLRLHEVDSRES